MKTKIGVFFGGKSVEHEVSIITALQAIENIDKNVRNKANVYKIENGKIISREII